MSAFGTGFSLLLWVDPCSSLLTQETLSDDYDRDSDRTIRGLLTDAGILLGMRWNVECTIHNIEGDLYAFTVVSRFTVSNPGIERALGNLTEHVRFIRGNPSNTLEELVRYKKCKEKWKVQEATTESTSGQEDTVRAGTSIGTKRHRF